MTLHRKSGMLEVVVVLSYLSLTQSLLVQKMVRLSHGQLRVVSRCWG